MDAERASSFQVDAVARWACLPTAELLNIEVPKNLLPSAPATNALSSGGPSLFMQDLGRDLACPEDAVIEVCQQWEKEAERTAYLSARRSEDAEEARRIGGGGLGRRQGGSRQASGSNRGNMERGSRRAIRSSQRRRLPWLARCILRCAPRLTPK